MAKQDVALDVDGGERTAVLKWKQQKQQLNPISSCGDKSVRYLMQDTQADANCIEVLWQGASQVTICHCDCNFLAQAVAFNMI